MCLGLWWSKNNTAAAASVAVAGSECCWRCVKWAKRMKKTSLHNRQCLRHDHFGCILHDVASNNSIGRRHRLHSIGADFCRKNVPNQVWKTKVRRRTMSVQLRSQNISRTAIEKLFFALFFSFFYSILASKRARASDSIYQNQSDFHFVFNDFCMKSDDTWERDVCVHARASERSRLHA